MKMGSSPMKIVMALALCLLLLGGFSAEAAGRINDGTTKTRNTWYLHCQPILPQSAKDCDSCCRYLGLNPSREVTHLCCCE
ncbi:hypothetical protein MKW92_045872 [Papaver armeniacum]|nr:hypothetical protein MKW92_045872 [Papaver armeniacum]